MNPTFFLSPAKPHKLIWGVGPTFVIPTATADQLGQGKFSLGPSCRPADHAGALGHRNIDQQRVVGRRIRQPPPVNQMLLQWFVNYNMKKGWYLVTSPINTADWRASSGNHWTVPLGGGVGRIMRLGPQPVNITAQLYGNAVYPTGASPWGMRLQIQFLYPKKP